MTSDWVTPSPGTTSPLMRPSCMTTILSQASNSS